MIREIESLNKLEKIIQKHNPSEWTEETFSMVNALFTSMEEDIMEAEKEYNNCMSEMKDLKKYMSDIRKMYFETHKEKLE